MSNIEPKTTEATLALDARGNICLSSEVEKLNAQYEEQEKALEKRALEIEKQAKKNN